MPYASKEDKSANDALRYERDKYYFVDKMLRHKASNPKLHAYWGQRHTSKQRYITFKLTFQEFVEWWGEDFEKRGRMNTSLQMCRYGDQGAYELGNIYKATRAENKSGPRMKDEGFHEDMPY